VKKNEIVTRASVASNNALAHPSEASIA
jgi:hypothetical protein